MTFQSKGIIDDTHSGDKTEERTPIRVGVVVPLANEETNITDFLTGVIRHLDPNDRLFCVLDNASKDNTRVKVETFGKVDPRVVVVWAPENRCVVDAYFRGYQAAYDAGAAWILEMDGGMSHRPEEIPQYLALLDKGYDYVSGCRFMPGGSHTGSVWRAFVSWAGTALTNFMLDTRMRDMTGGFEMFSRKAMQYVLQQGVRSRANFFQTEIKYMLRDSRWTEVPINYRSTKGTVPTGSIKESLCLLLQIRRDARQSR